VSVGNRTRWGWHCLDDSVARRLVAEAGISPGDLVLDIGAGRGALTAPLLDRGARVVAVELHAGRAAALRRRFADRPVTIVQADATDLRLPRRPFRVVANLPFASTTAILRRLLGPSSRLVRADLVVPRHVAARWSGGRGAGGTGWQSSFEVWTSRRLSRRAFHPPPPADASVLVIRRRV
jgi:23S rRNA (adenine-N6)-dimethyltransferase